jgi:hypothetical protein
MRFSKALAAAVAASLVATPTIAAAAGAPAPPTQVAPAAESVPGGQQQIYGASVLLQVGIVVVVALLVWLAIDQLGGGNDEPASP